MKVPCEEISNSLRTKLKKQVSILKKRGKIKLVTVLVGESKEQESFVKIKQTVAKLIGIDFEFKYFKEEPSFTTFISYLKEVSSAKETSGIIVQQPLPTRLQTDTIYNFIPPDKEIEGHHPKSKSLPPLGLAVLTALKYIYLDNKVSDKLFVNMDHDKNNFKNVLKNKKIVLVGRGMTAGLPIGKTLSTFKINYINISSSTFDPAQYYKDADVIITAVGKKIITPELLKPGVILLNVGVHHLSGKLLGDYDEKDIKSIASYYTTTPKGLGPIDVLYLYKNLLDAVAARR